MLNKEIRKCFGDRLKALRNQKGWTQKETAIKVDIGISQFNKYEMGLHIPPLEKLIQLAKLFDSTLDYLLMGEDGTGKSLHDVRFMKRLRELEHLQTEDKEAVIRILDGMILKSRTQSIMNLDE